MKQKIDERLQKAAEEYVKLYTVQAESYEACAEKEDVGKSFIAGAQWQRNSVWHEASEKPERGKYILIRDGIHGACTTGYWDLDFIFLGKDDKWCYISDIIPL